MANSQVLQIVVFWEKTSCDLSISSSGAISHYRYENVKSRTSTSKFAIVTYCEDIIN